MKRAMVLIYGVVCYLIFLGTFLYAIGFVANQAVPKSIDSGLPVDFWPSLFINLGLLALFGLQHSGMARPEFKQWWTKVIPESIERSTYVLLASLALILIYWQWQPMPELVWSVETTPWRAVLWTLYGFGWVLVLIATFMISHAHLFGVRQVHDYATRREPYRPGFQTPGLYRHIRHPIMAGFFIAFWATPEMSVGHLVFALVTTSYILVALQLEERDLVRAFGEKYQSYRRRVPMFVPRIQPGRPVASARNERRRAVEQES